MTYVLEGLLLLLEPLVGVHELLLGLVEVVLQLLHLLLQLAHLLLGLRGVRDISKSECRSNLQGGPTELYSGN